MVTSLENEASEDSSLYKRSVRSIPTEESKATEVTMVTSLQKTRLKIAVLYSKNQEKPNPKRGKGNRGYHGNLA